MKSITILLLAFSVGLAGCKSAQIFPQPTVDEGQVLVTLTGVPKAGVTGPSEEISDSYSGDTMSVERGKRFQRVDYDEIENVVVILERIDGTEIKANNLPAASIDFDEDGFISPFYTFKLVDDYLKLQNKSDDTLTVFFASRSDLAFDFVEKPNTESDVDSKYFMQSDTIGEWTITIDEIDSAQATLLTTFGLAWIGSSDEQAFFGNLDDGEYIVKVIAPRLPVVTRTLTVTKGKRSAVNVKLTVNGLPKSK